MNWKVLALRAIPPVLVALVMYAINPNSSGRTVLILVCLGLSYLVSIGATHFVAGGKRADVPNWFTGALFGKGFLWSAAILALILGLFDQITSVWVVVLNVVNAGLWAMPALRHNMASQNTQRLVAHQAASTSWQNEAVNLASQAQSAGNAVNRRVLEQLVDELRYSPTLSTNASRATEMRLLSELSSRPSLALSPEDEAAWAQSMIALVKERNRMTSSGA